MKLWMIPGWTRNDKISVRCAWGACHKRRCLRGRVSIIVFITPILCCCRCCCCCCSYNYFCIVSQLCWGRRHTSLFAAKRRFGLRLLFNRKRQNDILFCRGDRETERGTKAEIKFAFYARGLPDTISWGAINKKTQIQIERMFFTLANDSGQVKMKIVAQFVRRPP